MWLLFQCSPALFYRPKPAKQKFKDRVAADYSHSLAKCYCQKIGKRLNCRMLDGNNDCSSAAEQEARLNDCFHVIILTVIEIETGPLFVLKWDSYIQKSTPSIQHGRRNEEPKLGSDVHRQSGAASYSICPDKSLILH